MLLIEMRGPAHLAGTQEEQGEGLDHSPNWDSRRKGKAVRGNRLGLVSLSNSSRLWVTGAVPSRLVPGPRDLGDRSE